MPTSTLDRPKRYLDEFEHRRRSEQARAESKAQAKLIAEAEARFRARYAAITEQKAEDAIAELSDSDLEKLMRFGRMEMKQRGYFKPEEGSAVYGACRRRVIKELLAVGLRLWEIDEGDPVKEDEHCE